MGDFVRLIIDVVQLLWPLRIVRQWERGGYLMCGRWKYEVGPGVYPVVPWFFDVHEVSTATAYCGTSRQDITLSDGSTLSFAAIAKAHVSRAKDAILNVDDFRTSTQEVLAGVLADKLAEVDAARLSPEKRKRLCTDLKRWVGEETDKFGVVVDDVWFTSFVLNVKLHRLLVDQSAAPVW